MRRRKSGAPGRAPGCCWGSSWQASASATSSALESSSVSCPSSLTKEEIVRRSKMRRGKSEHLLDLRGGGVEREDLVERGRVQLGRRLRERIRRRKSSAPGCRLETAAVLEMEEHRGSERG